MFRSMKAILGYGIAATDGNIGAVADFYFDDETWAVRYLVADTGQWLPGRRVLLSPEAVLREDWGTDAVRVKHSRDEIRDSPPVSQDRPVSRQEEESIFRHYQWVPYWAPHAAPMTMAPVGVAQVGPEENAPQEQGHDPNLRSLREVLGYQIHAEDGDIGHVEDFIFNDLSWNMSLLVVDTRNWLPGRKVILLLTPVLDINWFEERVDVQIPRERIEQAPDFDPAEPVNEVFEKRIYDYYGRPHNAL